jgi:hypothetical protein
MKLVIKAYEPKYHTPCAYTLQGSAYNILKDIIDIVGRNYQIFSISFLKK